MSKEGSLPDDPISDLRAVAAQMHEVYQSYVDAGFTPGHSLYLTGILLKILTEASLGGPQE